MGTLRGKVLIIDDHQLFADGLGLLLSQLPENFSIEKYSDAQHVLETPEIWQSACLILIDLHMPNMSGFAFLKAMREQSNSPRVAVISGVESRAEIERALGLGAHGFIPKDAASTDMLEGVRAVLAGRNYLPPLWEGKIDWPYGKDYTQVDSDQPSKEVGPRQLEVLRLLEDGLQNKQIALVLGVSVSTVKSHTQALYRALNVSNRTACIKVANERGLL